MLQLGWLVEELKQQLSLELDFRHEAANAAAMAAAFAGRPEVAVPPVFAELSGERVLTMQWLEGCKVSLHCQCALHLHTEPLAIHKQAGA